MTRMATRRSDTARDTMRRFDGVRSTRTIATAAQTRVFPSTVPTMMKINTLRISTDLHDRPPAAPSITDDVVMVTSSSVQLDVMTTAALETTATGIHNSRLLPLAIKKVIP